MSLCCETRERRQSKFSASTSVTETNRSFELMLPTHACTLTEHSIIQIRSVTIINNSPIVGATIDLNSSSSTYVFFQLLDKNLSLWDRECGQISPYRQGWAVFFFSISKVIRTIFYAVCFQIQRYYLNAELKHAERFNLKYQIFCICI